jgi:hypothetical protein
METAAYKIDTTGCFQSRNTATQEIIPVVDNYVPYSGDTLVYLYCTKGTIHVELDGGDVIFHGAPTVRFFEGGLPLVGQYTGRVWVRKSCEDAEVYAVFENYKDDDRRELAYYSSPYDQNRGVKLRDLRDGVIYQVIGRTHGEPMVKKIEIL